MKKLLVAILLHSISSSAQNLYPEHLSKLKGFRQCKEWMTTTTPGVPDKNPILDKVHYLDALGNDTLIQEYHNRYESSIINLRYRNGKIIHVENSTLNSFAGNNLKQLTGITDFLYKSDLLTEIITTYYENGHAGDSCIFYLSYDKQKRMILQLVVCNSRKLDTNKTEYTYTDSGSTESTFTKGVVTSRKIVVYSQHKKIISEEKRNGSGALSSSMTYSYNKKGQMTQWLLKFNHGQLFPHVPHTFSKWQMSYDREGKLVETIISSDKRSFVRRFEYIK